MNKFLASFVSISAFAVVTTFAQTVPPSTAEADRKFLSELESSTASKSAPPIMAPVDSVPRQSVPMAATPAPAPREPASAATTAAPTRRPPVAVATAPAVERRVEKKPAPAPITADREAAAHASIATTDRQPISAPAEKKTKTKSSARENPVSSAPGVEPAIAEPPTVALTGHKHATVTTVVTVERAPGQPPTKATEPIPRAIPVNRDRDEDHDRDRGEDHGFLHRLFHHDAE